MIYNITGNFTKIAEIAGTIQNNSHVYSVEVSDKAVAGSGVLLYPLNKFSFSDRTIYLRCVDANAFAEIRVTPFAVEGGGVVSGGSSSTNINIASDQLISGMLTDVFGDTSGVSSTSGNVATDDQINNILDDIFPLP